MQSTMHVYEVRPRNDRRGFDLTSDVLPFGRLWYEDARGGLISRDQISMTAPYLKLQWDDHSPDPNYLIFTARGFAAGSECRAH
jgi:hypothetical protein